MNIYLIIINLDVIKLQQVLLFLISLFLKKEDLCMVLFLLKFGPQKTLHHDEEITKK